MNAVTSAIDDISIMDSSQAENKNQYLTFILAGEEYGVDILRVQEIKGWDNVTKIPNSPHYIKGVMNLRGTIVPIIDLRVRFNLDTLTYNNTTVVIVLKIHSEDKDRIMGIVVDAVSDVYDITREQMKPAPDFGDVISIEFIEGLATVENKMVIILNIDHLLSSNEMEIINRTSASHTGNKAANKPIDEKSNIELIEDSFSAVASQGEKLVSRFYEELFTRYPDVKPLFAHLDMKKQQSKLLSALKLVVSNLKNPPFLKETLINLGKRHKNYGADAGLYTAVRNTLLDVLKETAGIHWTQEINTAWENALDDIAKIMQSAT